MKKFIGVFCTLLLILTLIAMAAGFVKIRFHVPKDILKSATPSPTPAPRPTATQAPAPPTEEALKKMEEMDGMLWGFITQNDREGFMVSMARLIKDALKGDTQKFYDDKNSDVFSFDEDQISDEQTAVEIGADQFFDIWRNLYATLKLNQTKAYITYSDQETCDGEVMHYNKSNGENLVIPYHFVNVNGEWFSFFSAGAKREERNMNLNEKYRAARAAGRNAMEIGSRLWTNTTNVIEGRKDYEISYLWENEDGSVDVAITMYNGTNKDTVFSKLNFKLSDRNLGAVVRVNREINIKVQAGTNNLFVIHLTNNKELLKKGRWTSLEAVKY